VIKMKHAVATVLSRLLLGGVAAMAASACSKASKDAAPPSTPTASGSQTKPADPSTTRTDPGPAPGPNPDPTARPSSEPPPVAPALVADPAAMPAAAKGDLAFATALHGQLRKESGNLFFSPASVRLAMAMTAMGAKGETAIELAKGLVLPAKLDEAAAGFAAILDSFAQRPKLQLRPDMQDWEKEEAERKVSTVAIANRVWPQAGRPFEKSFADTMASRFGAPMQPLDFAADKEAARKTINAWIADRTEQKIPELLLPPNVTSDTKLVLTNAIYFKAKWAEPFSENATREAQFTTDQKKKVKVSMMGRIDFMNYAETATYQAVELPYADGSLSMTVLLPRAGKSIADVETSALAAFAGGTSKLAGERVALQLPKFKIEARFALADALAKLGMPSAFSGKADFSGIDGTRELFIGSVIHQAVITVDESGTEAAAATAVSMRAGSAAPTAPPKAFIADRPFAFFIRDAKTGTLLFVGRLADPSAAK
jgi:serpin B